MEICGGQIGLVSPIFQLNSSLLGRIIGDVLAGVAEVNLEL